MTPLASWAADYIGIPWRVRGRDRAGVDCWGLCCLVYREVFGIVLPSFVEEYETVRDDARIRELLTVHVPEAWTPVPRALPGDGLVFRLGRGPHHVGLYVGAGRFLHVNSGTVASCLERLESPAWAKRLLGAYRHGR